MNEKQILELLYEIAKETDITIKLNKKSGELEFVYNADEELKQNIKQSDIEEYKQDQSKLLKYALEEIKSTILGSREISKI